jgi:hypothetical protein
LPNSQTKDLRVRRTRPDFSDRDNVVTGSAKGKYNGEVAALGRDKPQG